MSARDNPTRCPKRGCGFLLRFEAQRTGALAAVCDPCDRNARGVCRDCPARLPSPTALRCLACRKVRVLACQRARYANPESSLRGNALAYGRRPDVRARQEARRQARIAADHAGYLAAVRAEHAAHRQARNQQKRERYASNARVREAAKAEARRRHGARREEIAAQKRRDHAAFRARFGFFPTRCQACGVTIPYAGRGGKKKWCATHRPHRVRTGARSAALQERAA